MTALVANYTTLLAFEGPDRISKPCVEGGWQRKYQILKGIVLSSAQTIFLPSVCLRVCTLLSDPIAYNNIFSTKEKVNTLRKDRQCSTKKRWKAKLQPKHVLD